MAAMRFDPLRGFDSLAKKVSLLAQDLEKGFNIEYGAFSPKVDISEDDANVFIHAEMPGVKKEDVKLTINDENVLLIKGEKKNEIKDESNENGRSYLRVERNYGAFTRSFLLPDNIKRDSIKAKFDNGVLNITLDKIEPEKPKETEVTID